MSDAERSGFELEFNRKRVKQRILFRCGFWLNKFLIEIEINILEISSFRNEVNFSDSCR